MKKVIFFLLASLVLIGCSNSRGDFIQIVDSNESVDQTVKKLHAIIKKAKLTHFYTMDHAQNAKEQKLTLRDTTLVVFGNAHMGSKLMQCNQSIGLDLPMKILVYEDFNGDTKISYTNPEYYSLKHNIKDKGCLNIINKASIALDAISVQLQGK
ncbi:MAG: DUF302 domain-containing protein [Campylobacterota bacterium]|nr:DUF302 domain-containing protein [Campylobacterota bacterium]